MNPTQPIQNAKNVLLSESSGTLPNVAGGILNYFKPLTLIRVRKETINMQVAETREEIESSGFITPAKQSLSMKPEGQRIWKGWTLFLPLAVDLVPDDVVTIVNLVQGNTSYRVLGKNDYSQMGYVSYDLAQDYS